MASSATETVSPPFEPGTRVWVDPDDLKPFPLEDETYVERDNAELVESIEEHGFREGELLTVCPDGTILIGHRRTDAAKQVGIDRVPVEVSDVDPDSPEAVRIFLSSNQHRDKTPGERINEGTFWEEIERERAQERISSGGTHNFAGGEKGETRELVADRIGMSRESYRKGKKVKELAEEGDPIAEKAWERLETGDESIHGAYTTVMDAVGGEDDEEEEEDDTADAADAETDDPDGSEDVDDSDEAEAFDNVDELVGDEDASTDDDPDEDGAGAGGDSEQDDEPGADDATDQDDADGGEEQSDEPTETEGGSTESEPSTADPDWDAVGEGYENGDHPGGDKRERWYREKIREKNSRIDELESIVREFIRAVDNQDPEAIRGTAERAEGLVDA